MSFSGRHIFCGSDDKHIHVWDSLKTTYNSKFSLLLHTADSVTDINPISNRNKICLIPFVSTLAALVGHDNRVTSICMSPNGMALTSCSWDQSARVWG